MTSLAGRSGSAALALTLALTPHFVAAANAPRMSTAETAFRASNPCPSTGLAQGACTGYVVDRIIPRLCGGQEDAANMQWLTLLEARVKARWDRIGCRAGRKLVLPGEFTSTTEAFPIGDSPAPVQVEPLGSGARVEEASEPAAPAIEPVAVPETGEAAAGEEPELPHQ